MKTLVATARFAAASTLAVALAAASLGGLAAQPAPAHDHDHGHAAAAKPLKPGTKWATDTALRDGMARIRAAYEPKLGAIHKNSLAPSDYKALAEATTREVAGIVANCKLPPEADAALHGVLAEFGEGTEAMAGASASKQRAGALKVVTALERYGRTFDHPGWKRLHG